MVWYVTLKSGGGRGENIFCDSDGMVCYSQEGGGGGGACSVTVMVRYVTVKRGVHVV